MCTVDSGSKHTQVDKVLLKPRWFCAWHCLNLFLSTLLPLTLLRKSLCYSFGYPLKWTPQWCWRGHDFLDHKLSSTAHSCPIKWYGHKGDKDCMVQMLERLKVYPLKDMVVPRLHTRLCFTGLAAFALRERGGNDSFWELGKNVSLWTESYCIEVSTVLQL